MYAVNPKQFNKTYRIQIAHTVQEIDTIIWMGVFCSDKTGFVRPGHILCFICFRLQLMINLFYNYLHMYVHTYIAIVLMML